MTIHIPTPRIERSASACRADQQKKLLEAYQRAATLASEALHYTTKLRARCPRGQRARWNQGPARRYFGPYSAAKLEYITKVLAGVNERFFVGFSRASKVERTRIECFPRTHRRCQRNLLANASIFGTIRVCPRLLRRSNEQVAAILLHEMLHQGLGVGDRRHRSCGISKDRRCYREGALRLVEHGRADLAIRNNDNYVGFALALAKRGDTPASSRPRHPPRR